MLRIVRFLAPALLVLSLPASAALPSFGEPFPLTDTRYAGVREYVSDYFAPDTPLLRSNGPDAFLFNYAERRLQVARIVEGEPRIPQPVFPFFVQYTYQFDVVWTGSHFLVVAPDPDHDHQFYGRLVDATGAPVGTPFAIGELNGTFPRLAFNGRNVLMLYASLTLNSVVLTPEGRLTSFPPQEIGGLISEPAVMASNGKRFAAIVWSGNEGFDDLYLFDENGQLSVRRDIPSIGPLWAIASDGDRFLAVNGYADEARALLLDADGATLTTLSLDPDTTHFHRRPLVTWAGFRWVTSTTASQTGRVVEVDKDAREILSTQTFPNTQVGVVTRRGKPFAIWWANKELLGHDYPAGTESGEVIGRQAVPQDLLAVAASGNATLVLWYEEGYRMGIRASDGRWTQRTLDAFPVRTLLAASNGHGFVVIADNDVTHLSEEGTVLWRGTVPFLPSAVAWNGTHYGLIGVSDDQIVSSVLTTDASTPVVLPIQPDAALAMTLTSNGNGFLAGWMSRTGLCPEPPCGATDLHVLPLDAAMRASGSALTLVEETEILSYAIGWNGERYVAAHAGAGKVETVELTPGGAVGNRRLIANEGADGSSTTNVNVVPAADSMAIGWVVAGSGDRYSYRGTTLDRDGNISPPVTLHTEESLGSGFRTRLLGLGDGRLAYFYSATSNDAPHYGSRRTMLSLADLVPAERPGAPQATLRRSNTGVILSWTRPSGAVNGFRVEQRTGDDAWMEIGSWLDDEQLELPVTLPEGRTTTFRMRAFNDAGAGEHSLAVSLEHTKRRAVR
jgi:hypothetical protein